MFMPAFEPSRTDWLCEPGVPGAPLPLPQPMPTVLTARMNWNAVWPMMSNCVLLPAEPPNLVALPMTLPLASVPGPLPAWLPSATTPGTRAALAAAVSPMTSEVWIVVAVRAASLPIAALSDHDVTVCAAPAPMITARAAEVSVGPPEVHWTKGASALRIELPMVSDGPDVARPAKVGVLVEGSPSTSACTSETAGPLCPETEVTGTPAVDRSSLIRLLMPDSARLVGTA